VLAIGGLKEKLLAGLQARIKHIIIPKDNERELKEMPKEILEGVNVVVADSISQVIDFALVRQPKKSDWPKADASKKSEDKDKNKK
jgi:ATP-dependent Lon protease